MSQVKSVDKLMILVYNSILFGLASFLVFYCNASVWIFVVAIIFGASWSEKDKEEKNGIQKP